MKAKLSLLVAVSLAVLAPVLLAAETQVKPVDQKNNPKCEHCKDACKCAQGKCECNQTANNAKEKTVMLTGSNLPQRVTKVGKITDGAEPLVVVSHDDLENTGEMNLASALRKSVPSVH